MYRSSTTRQLVLVGGILALVLIFHFVGITSPLEDYTVRLTRTALSQNQSLSVKVRDQYRFFANQTEFISLASQCFDDQLNQSITDTEIKKVEAENAELRALLTFKKRNPTAPLLANVISKDLVSAQQIIIIDKGAVEGIKVGDPVVARNGIFVGLITKANNTTAAVRLINDNQSKVAVTLLNKDKSIGVLEGGFGISLKMRFIPRNEIISVGDKVISSGLESSIPYGLSIGTVSVIENEAYKPFQEAVIDPSIDLSKLTVLGVLINSD